MVAGLLFLAFAYLAVGQAAVNRGGAQTAADAAALAAAQEARDRLAGLWVDALSDPAKWTDIFEGKGAGDPCWRAEQLAAENDARLNSCDPALLRYTVEVQTNKTVGDSVVPGTEDMKSTKTATAVIDPLCDFAPPSGSEGATTEALPQLTCRGGKVWEPDPDDRAGLPKPEDLFDVHLAD